MTSPGQFTFRREQRLTHDLEYKAVYEARVRSVRGGFSLAARPNSLGRHRLGLAVPRGVGSAPRRNLFKRLIREAFRLMQHDLPGLPDRSYDLIVGLRAHELPSGRPSLVEVRAALDHLAAAADRQWRRRGQGPKQPLESP